MYFTVKISEAELDVVRLALGRMVEAKPVVERKAATSAVLPEFNTGDDRLDAFMRDHWRPADRVKAERRASAGMPTAKSLVFPFDLKRLATKPARESVRQFNEAAVAAWRRLGYDVKVERLDASVTGGYVALDGRNVTVTRAGA